MTITLYDSDISFLKLLIKTTTYGLLQDKVSVLFSSILNQNEHLLAIVMQSLYHIIIIIIVVVIIIVVIIIIIIIITIIMIINHLFHFSNSILHGSWSKTKIHGS